MSTWTLTLNQYQRDNLLGCLNAIGYPFGSNDLRSYTCPDDGTWLIEIVKLLERKPVDTV